MTTDMRWAIDSNIIIQQSTGRLISGCVEATRGSLLVPERALTLAKTKYREIANRRAHRVIEFDPDLDPNQLRPEERRELAIQCALAIQTSFSNWASAETQRNDGLWALAPDTTASATIAVSLYEAGIARTGEISRVGEDAEVAAQALADGCRWIASNNLGFLEPEKLKRWIAHEQQHGRLDQADTSFICSIDTAIEQMCGPREDSSATTKIAAIAWELNRPSGDHAARNLGQRIKSAIRSVRALHDSGATETAERMRTYFHKRVDPNEVHRALAACGYTGTLERTRTAYGRLATTTRQAQETILAGYRPQWPNVNEWDRS